VLGGTVTCITRTRRRGRSVTPVTATAASPGDAPSDEPKEETVRTSDAGDPINQLYGEHDEALAHLQALRVSGRAMIRDGARPEHVAGFREALRFLDNEIRVHNQWEEDHLFPALELYTGPGGPCAVMRAEHRTLWDTYGALGPLLEKLQAGSSDPESVERLAHLADAVVDLLVDHIHKENEILFPMARRMLDLAAIGRLAAARSR
jgi:hemerythrin-like domain-containing protein